MNPDRKSAIIAGVLFIIADVAGIPSLILSKPLLDAPDYLVKVAANPNQVSLAALLVLIMAVACAGIAVSMYPVLKRFNAGLALGSVVFRIIEATFQIVIMISFFLLLELGREFMKAGAPDPSYFQILGGLLFAGRDWLGNLIILVNWCIGALMYSYIFYESKLVPRWLSAWGLAAYPLPILAGISAMFHLISPTGAIWGVLIFPAALQELILAVWLIVKGFNPSAKVKGNVEPAQP